VRLPIRHCLRTLGPFFFYIFLYFGSSSLTMLRFIRDGQRWIVGTIVFFIGIVFVFFMAQGNPTGPGNIDAFAMVGDVRIDLQDFRRARQQQEDYLRQAMGARYNAEESQDYIDQLTISGLIRNALFIREANELGLRVSDEEVRALILDFPGLRSADGTFSNEQYMNYAERQFGTERNFIESIRREMLADKTRNLLVLSFGLSDAEVRDALRFERDQVRLLIVNIPTEIDEELEFSDEEIAALVENEEGRLRAIYQENIQEYDLPERAHARHILIRTPPTASDEELLVFKERIDVIRQRIVDGEEFAEVAKTESQDPGSAERGGDLGTFRRGEMVPVFEDAVFNSTPGELSEVLKTEFGYHIFYTESVLEAESHSYEEVSAELAKRALAEDAAVLEADTLGEELNQLVTEGSSLEEAARELKLSIERTGLFGRRGDHYIPTLGPSEEMMEFVFAAKEGDITPITVVEGKRFTAQVAERLTITDADLEESLPAERARLLNLKRTEALTEWLTKEREGLEEVGQLVVNQGMLGSS
jgi:peptidyl-prolyl cis-trans isomerase D